MSPGIYSPVLSWPLCALSRRQPLPASSIGGVVSGKENGGGCVSTSRRTTKRPRHLASCHPYHDELLHSQISETNLRSTSLDDDGAAFCCRGGHVGARLGGINYAHRAPRPARHGNVDDQHAALVHGLCGHVLRSLVSALQVSIPSLCTVLLLHSAVLVSGDVLLGVRSIQHECSLRGSKSTLFPYSLRQLLYRTTPVIRPR